MKIYGNEKTALVLSDKAFEVYSNTDPLKIVEEDDGTYTMKGVIDRYGMSAEQVNSVLESFADDDEAVFSEKTYRVLPEYVAKWSDRSDSTDELIVTGEEITHLACEWGVSVEDLLEQCEEYEEGRAR